jgi:hypothetical protein
LGQCGKEKWSDHKDYIKRELNRMLDAATGIDKVLIVELRPPFVRTNRCIVRCRDAAAAETFLYQLRTWTEAHQLSFHRHNGNKVFLTTIKSPAQRARNSYSW